MRGPCLRVCSRICRRCFGGRRRHTRYALNARPIVERRKTRRETFGTERILLAVPLAVPAAGIAVAALPVAVPVSAVAVAVAVIRVVAAAGGWGRRRRRSLRGRGGRRRARVLVALPVPLVLGLVVAAPV